MVVAFGAMSLLSALVIGVASLGLPTDTPFPGTEVQGTVFAGVVLVITQFVAYLWGGYTSGRMARGAGVGNGLLVPLIAILLLALLGAIVATFSTSTNLNVPFQSRLLVEDGVLVRWGPAIGIASVVAMFVGGGLGGVMGARWHTRLEKEAATETATPASRDTTTTDSTP
jgi:hypothetical protein